MKIISWNCQGAFRKKFEFISEFNADVIVIQECENPIESKDKKYKNWATNYLWIGDSKNKGLGVFAKSEIQLTPLNWSDIYKDHKVKHFLPCIINKQFQLLAVWTHQNNSPNFGYIGQFWKYLQVNKSKLENSIIVGDFNSNAIWDQWDRWWNHSDVVKELKDLSVESAYHVSTNEDHGKETIPTFYLQRNEKKSYHIDYCFASSNILSKMDSLSIEPITKWTNLSDHSPMVINFNF